MLQLTASPWTTEASTRERWQFGVSTNRKATSSNRDPSLTSLYYYKVALSLHRDKWTTIIRLWWLSQWLVTHGHHLAVTIYLHVAPSNDRHSRLLQRLRITSAIASGLREGSSRKPIKLLRITLPSKYLKPEQVALCLIYRQVRQHLPRNTRDWLRKWYRWL